MTIEKETTLLKLKFRRKVKPSEEFTATDVKDIKEVFLYELGSDQRLISVLDEDTVRVSTILSKGRAVNVHIFQSPGAVITPGVVYKQEEINRADIRFHEAYIWDYPFGPYANFAIPHRITWKPSKK